jgi:hypothetical protein
LAGGMAGILICRKVAKRIKKPCRQL